MMIVFNRNEYMEAVQSQSKYFQSDPLETRKNHVYEVGSLGFDLVLCREFKNNPKKEFFLVIPDALLDPSKEYVRVLCKFTNKNGQLMEDYNYLLHNDSSDGFVKIFKTTLKEINKCTSC